MTKADGVCNIDSVAAGEVYINLLGPVPMLSARYALTSSETSERFGSGNRNQNWSQETMNLLSKFIASLEKDVCDAVFEPQEASQPVETFDNSVVDRVPGL